MPDIKLMGATYPDVPAVDLPKSGGGTSRFYDPSEILYASSPTSGGPATKANAIQYGECNSTSTSTVFTATIQGITSYYDGLTVILKNGVVTSAANFTIDINGLGAKGVYSNMGVGYGTTAATRETTIFNINYSIMLIYSSTIVSGGGWIFYRGYAPEPPTNISELNNDSGYITGMYIASYGHSTYADILAAYNANKVVYCRASSSSNPGSGSQTRMAFLAYVNKEKTPTEFEFQYYRSVSSHSASQQGDQVYVYKVNSSGTWSVTIREAYTKIVAGTGMGSSYANGTLTLTATGGASLPSVSASDNGKVLMVVNGAWAAAALNTYNGGVS